MTNRTFCRRRFAGAASIGLFLPALRPAFAATSSFVCASGAPAEHPTIVRSRQMWEAVERESGGRLHVQVFPNSQLGSDDALVSQVRLGAIQFYLGFPNFA